MTMRPLTIGFISQDWSRVGDNVFPNGCTWYRCVLPAAAMIRRGHVCHIGSIATGNGLPVVAVHPPLYKQPGIFSNHQMIVYKLPMHISLLQSTEEAIKQGRKIVVDIDDWFDELDKTNKAYSSTDPEIHKDNNRDIYFQIIEMAHALICSTPVLKDFYSKKYPTKPVFMIRNSIDIDRWPIKSPTRREPKIGWVGATPWRSRDLEQLSSFMDEYLKRQNLMFHHSGHINGQSSAASLLGIPESRTTTSGMSTILDLRTLFNDIDIGIVPLNDVPFNHAKSYLKGLEYAAAGIPFVASALPEYEVLAGHGIGRVAKTPSQWMSHFDELLDYGMRRDEAITNREILDSEFSIESRAKEWERTYTNIMDIT